MNQLLLENDAKLIATQFVIGLARFRLRDWLIFALVMPFLASELAFGQTRTPSKRRDIRISTKHPSVYISFVKVGTAEPLGAGESNQRVWLRFHNNTRWSLSLTLTGFPPDKYGEEIDYYVKTHKKQIDFVSMPQIVIPQRIPPGVDLPPSKEPVAAVKTEEKCEQLDFYSGGARHLFTVRQVPSGKSVLFSVPREYLCKDNYITVSFEYAWEPESDRVYHEVQFSGSQIPQ